MKKILVISVFTIFVVAACKKEEKSNPGTSKKEILTSKVWKETARTVAPAIQMDSVLVTDVYATYKNCEKDNIYKFKADGTFTYESGLTKCQPTDPDIQTSGTWNFNGDETQLVLYFVGFPTYYNIVSYSSSAAVLSWKTTENGVQHTYTMTFEAQ